MNWSLEGISKLFSNLQRKAYCSLEQAQKGELRRKLKGPLQGNSHFFSIFQNLAEDSSVASITLTMNKLYCYGFIQKSSLHSIYICIHTKFSIDISTSENIL